MLKQVLPVLIASVLLAMTCNCSAGAPKPFTIDLWPGTAPGEKGSLEPERDMTKTTDNLVQGKTVIRIGNVAKPTLTVYRPEPEKDTGASVIVCPGGGYHILALDLEGTEICEWLNSIGVTGILLKYRVPKREGLEKHTAAAQDGQRAVSLVRQKSKEWGIAPDRIGILGFSAGGHLSAFVSNNAGNRLYAPIDRTDEISCRPDFNVLIYPAYLTVKEQDDKISPELPVSSNTPPTFIAMTQDDPIRIETAMYYSLALKNAKVPCELHVYPRGGHGYGLRRGKDLVTTWPSRVQDWLENSGYLRK